MDQATPSAPATVPADLDTIESALDAVQASLTRLDDGTYGRCATCGDPIDDTLLGDDPTGAHCAAHTRP